MFLPFILGVLVSYWLPWSNIRNFCKGGWYYTQVRMFVSHHTICRWRGHKHGFMTTSYSVAVNRLIKRSVCDRCLYQTELPYDPR